MNQQTYFEKVLLDKWEKNDGVNFAIALARITGWLLQVDWLASYEDEPVTDMIPLRVTVGTDQSDIYDFTGKKDLDSYYENILMAIATKRANGKQGGIANKFYSEEELSALPLRTKPTEAEILEAQEIILKSHSFLNLVPTRINPEIPAHIAAHYTYGHCVVFAQAKKDSGVLPATAIIASRFTEQFSGSRLGFCHSVIMHPDGEAEDVWGKQPLSNILKRYGILDYSLSTEEHDRVNETLKRNSPLVYNKSYDRISTLLKSI
jgi:hypothetical protein